LTFRVCSDSRTCRPGTRGYPDRDGHQGEERDRRRARPTHHLRSGTLSRVQHRVSTAAGDRRTGLAVTSDPRPLECDPDEGRPEAVAHQAGTADPAALFRRQGTAWIIRFDGFAVQLSDQKGFHDLIRLLSRPGQEIHCLELANRPEESGAADRVLDERARREIQERVRELQREIDDADAAHDIGRAERAREELDRIVELLSGALGLRGRPRALGSAAERARSAVTWRIRSAIKRSRQRILASADISRTPCGPGPSASTCPKRPSSGRSSVEAASLRPQRKLRPLESRRPAFMMNRLEHAPIPARRHARPTLEEAPEK